MIRRPPRSTLFPYTTLFRSAAEQVRSGTKSRQEIPDFTGRSDEIGHLSGALRDMTRALYNRIEGTERFAADVAHELKNPLTSLRSAVETRSEERRVGKECRSRWSPYH